VLCAEIDLSFANIATMSGIVMAAVWATERPMLAIPLALLAAVVLGMLNGMFTARFAIPSFMVTPAMMQISEGVTIYISKGKPYFEVPEVLQQLGGGRIGPGARPRAGRCRGSARRPPRAHLHAVRPLRLHDGGNREAAELAGVRVRRSSSPASRCARSRAPWRAADGRAASTAPSPAWPATCCSTGIAAVVLGGTSLFGGEGG
jgi:ribose/xylose/arabinose/galactoside ABC-type transport system permease subunit